MRFDNPALLLMPARIPDRSFFDHWRGTGDDRFIVTLQGVNLELNVLDTVLNKWCYLKSMQR